MRSFNHTDFGQVDLSAVSVVLPARECATTVGPIVETIAGAGQILVVDAASADGTAEVAAGAGAEVGGGAGASAGGAAGGAGGGGAGGGGGAELMPDFGPVLGKGDAMWRSL